MACPTSCAATAVAATERPANTASDRNTPPDRGSKWSLSGPAFDGWTATFWSPLLSRIRRATSAPVRPLPTGTRLFLANVLRSQPWTASPMTSGTAKQRM